MSANIECPICMDDIDFTKNCITTECGHTFHASCVMRNVATNGFACPMCRTAMAEEYEDEVSETSEVSEEQEVYDDFALRGFRFFFNNISGEEHDHEDVLEEQEDNEEEQPIAKPSPAFIVQKLNEHNITMEDLVKVLLMDHEEYSDEELEFEQVDTHVWDTMRIVISNYQPSAAPVVVEPAAELVQSEQIDEAAQPKHPNVTVRRIMTHI